MEVKTACDSTQQYAALFNSALGPQNGSLHAPSMSESLENGKAKARKPYTITKTRERWSEEEHMRFVEALRLHGRAWRKIEEHIGTKTAVQIRSHAQKFFNKLEKKKEAGEAPDKEEDISIPPPRPKRKPAKLLFSRVLCNNEGVSTAGFTGTSQLQQPQLPGVLTGLPQQQVGTTWNGLNNPSIDAGEVSEATVAAVTAAASAAAAAAAAAVVAAAGAEVQTHMAVHPPKCFPFFGMPPSALAHMTPAGVPALEQAALLAMQQQLTTAKPAAGMGCFDAAAPDTAALAAHGAAAVAAAVPVGMRYGEQALDRFLLEATGTTDGTHVSANAQLRGSDGDSACSRETDNQDACPNPPMDVAWHAKLHQQAFLQQQQQQDISSSDPSAAALVPGGGMSGLFDAQGGTHQLHWGLAQQLARYCQSNASGTAGVDLPSMQALQQLLNNPLYLQAAAAAELAAAGAASAAAMNQRCSGGDGVAAGGGGNTTRTKSRRAAPSGNSGSSGPPVGSKRSAGEVAGSQPAKKPAREVSGTNEEAERMEVVEALEAPPSSPSIQEKELKASSQPSQPSQPSNTNGNTSGSNESNGGSNRRQGTAQAEGSHPTHYSSGNGYSVRDSNTGTNTNGHTNGNGHSSGHGTSAFNPVGHHHSHHHHHHHHHYSSCNQPPNSHRTNNHSSNQLQECVAGPVWHHSHGAGNHGSHTGGTTPPGDAPGVATMTGASGRGPEFTREGDEGRSSSDLEGPNREQMEQQQQQQQQEFGGQDDLMNPDGEEEEEEEEEGQEYAREQQNEQQQDSVPGSQLQSLMASLQVMAGHPMMLQQAYGAAAAAAATAQQVMTIQQQQQQQQPAPQYSVLLEALQQHMQRQHHQQVSGSTPVVSQGFAPWHASLPTPSSAAAADGSCGNLGGFGSAGMGSQLMHHQAHAQAQLVAAAAGLMGLGAGWTTTTNSSGSGASGLCAFAQVAAAQARQQQQQQQQPQHHHHSHHHHQHHQQQLNGSGGSSCSAEPPAAAAAAAAAGLQQLQHGGGGGSSYSRLNGSSAPLGAMGVLAGVSSCLSELDLLNLAARGNAVGAGGPGSGNAYLG